MKAIARRAAQTVLALILLGSIVIFLGAPGILASAALLGAATLAGLGLSKLGTFNK